MGILLSVDASLPARSALKRVPSSCGIRVHSADFRGIPAAGKHLIGRIMVSLRKGRSCLQYFARQLWRICRQTGPWGRAFPKSLQLSPRLQNLSAE